MANLIVNGIYDGRFVQGVKENIAGLDTRTLAQMQAELANTGKLQCRGSGYVDSEGAQWLKDGTTYRSLSDGWAAPQGHSLALKSIGSYSTQIRSLKGFYYDIFIPGLLPVGSYKPIGDMPKPLTNAWMTEFFRLNSPLYLNIYKSALFETVTIAPGGVEICITSTLAKYAVETCNRGIQYEHAGPLNNIGTINPDAFGGELSGIWAW